MFHFFLAAAVAAAQPPKLKANPGNAIELAESRGLRLYQGYRVATYAAAKSEAVFKDRIREINGYVITNSGNDEILTFVGRSGDSKAYAIWRGRYHDGIEVEGSLIPRGSDAAALSDDERLGFQAERAALNYVFSNQKKLGPISCAGDVMPNVVVLSPMKADPALAVYIMTPQANKNVVPLGGHYRIVLDGNLRVQSFNALTEECHDLDVFEDGGRLAADRVPHRSEATPNERPGLASPLSGAKIMVDTGQKPYWKVERGKILKDDTP